MEAGADAYLQKPFNIADLERIVEKYLAIPHH
jgi:DNA-binding response OmpR family regulator